MKNLLNLRLDLEIDKDTYNQKNNEIVLEIEELKIRKNKIKNRNDEEKIALGVELGSSLYESYNGGNNEYKGGYLKKLMVELSLDNKKELTYAENSYLNFVKFLNFQFGNGE